MIHTDQFEYIHAENIMRMINNHKESMKSDEELNLLSSSRDGNNDDPSEDEKGWCQLLRNVLIKIVIFVILCFGLIAASLNDDEYGHVELVPDEGCDNRDNISDSIFTGSFFLFFSVCFVCYLREDSERRKFEAKIKSGRIRSGTAEAKIIDIIITLEDSGKQKQHIKVQFEVKKWNGKALRVKGFIEATAEDKKHYQKGDGVEVTYEINNETNFQATKMIEGGDNSSACFDICISGSCFAPTLFHYWYYNGCVYGVILHVVLLPLIAAMIYCCCYNSMRRPLYRSVYEPTAVIIEDEHEKGDDAAEIIELPLIV